MMVVLYNATGEMRYFYILASCLGVMSSSLLNFIGLKLFVFRRDS